MDSNLLLSEREPIHKITVAFRGVTDWAPSAASYSGGCMPMFLAVGLCRRTLRSACGRALQVTPEASFAM